jgi:tetrahydromethanopterin S-methyltransferase subunit F
VGGVQLERPQPARNERARTYELDTDERRRIIGREEDLGSGRVARVVGVPGLFGLAVGVVSQAPIRRRVSGLGMAP